MAISRSRRGVGFVVPAALSAFLAVSCGGGDGSNVNGGPGNGNGSGAAPNQPNLGNGANAPGSGASGPGNTMTISRDDACVTDSAAADAIPAVVQMVVDTSGSMDWGADGDHNPPRNMSKWDITSAALKEAVAALPASVALGINFYPNTDNDDPCIRNRVALPIAALGDDGSNQRDRCDAAIDGAGPQGGTPTHAAFLFGAETVAASNIEGRKFVLLITDGVPTRTLDCGGDGMTAVDSGPLIAAAQAAHDDDNISTFVIGSPGSDDARHELSRIASVGGTAAAGCSDDGPAYCHLDMTTAADFGAALAAGLADIAGRISACEYAIPAPPNGQDIDYNAVNVLYTKGDGTEASLPQGDASNCTAGWMYTNNNTQVTLCGKDCDAVKADPGAKVELIFGCTTVVGDPPK